MGDSAGHDGGHGRSAESVSVERRIAGLAGRVVDVVSPLLASGEDCEVGWLAGGEFTLDAKNAPGAGGEQFDHTHERDFFGVNELFESERDGGFKTENAERCAVEFDVLESGFVRSVVGGDNVHGAVDESCDHSFAIFA